MSDWRATEPTIEAAFERFDDPLRSLTKAETPAIVIRDAYDASQCAPLIRRMMDTGLARDPNDRWAGKDGRSRIDIGTSLGNRGDDKARFFEHAESTHFLFRFLFGGFDNPVETIYGALSKLAPTKRVVTAVEPDGRRYGPAIFRVHYESHAYQPHIDSVRLREQRVDYAVHRFDHQFAGVLCVQNAAESGATSQGIMHRCLWTEDVQPHIARGTFHDYADEQGIENRRVDLEAGDLYFFNTRLIHEVSAIHGTQPRIVLAVFIGYSEDDDEVFVWS